MKWLDGRPLMQRLAEDPPLEERNRVAEGVVPGVVCAVLRYGVIHGDPHLGNYQVRPDGSVNLLDFGAIRVFSARFVTGVIELFERCGITMTPRRIRLIRPGGSSISRMRR